MHGWSEGCLNPCNLASAWSGLLLSCCAPYCCSPDSWHILRRMLTADHSGTWQSTAVRVSRCSSCTASDSLNRCSPFRHSAAALHVVNLSLMRRKLSFALQLPFGYSCPPVVLDLRLFASLLVHPCICLRRVPRFRKSYEKVSSATARSIHWSKHQVSKLPHLLHSAGSS
jgi:hypothetical protein